MPTAPNSTHSGPATGPSSLLLERAHDGAVLLDQARVVGRSAEALGQRGEPVS